MLHKELSPPRIDPRTTYNPAGSAARPFPGSPSSVVHLCAPCRPSRAVRASHTAS